MLACFSLSLSGQDIFGFYSNDNGFCGHTINLWEDSTYFVEYGCEGQSVISFGQFKVINGIVKLFPSKKEQYNLLSKMTWVDSLNELNIPKELAPCVVLTDKNKKPINGEMIVLYDSKGSYFKNNESRNGSYMVPSHNYNEIYLPSLSLIFQRFVSFQVPENSMRKGILLVELNINSTFLHYNQIEHSSDALLEAQYEFIDGLLHLSVNNEKVKLVKQSKK